MCLFCIINWFQNFSQKIVFRKFCDLLDKILKFFNIYITKTIPNNSLLSNITYGYFKKITDEKNLKGINVIAKFLI